MLQVENVFGNITLPDLKCREHTKVKNLKRKKKRKDHRQKEVMVYVVYLSRRPESFYSHWPT